MKRLTESSMVDISELIGRSLDGDQTAFRRLVEHHQPFAYALALRMLSNADDAGDVVQESFVSVWRNLRRYDGSAAFTTWLYRIVVNRTLDRLRSRARERLRTESLDEMDERHDVIEEAAVPGSMEDNLVEFVKACASALPPTQRAVFILRDLQDLSVRETSQVLSISEAAVKTNLSYARRAVRDAMKSAGFRQGVAHEL
jgi:RNA polymerase sigma-70 factor (ECF subfamily)